MPYVRLGIMSDFGSGIITGMIPLVIPVSQLIYAKRRVYFIIKTAFTLLQKTFLNPFRFLTGFVGVNN